MKKEPKKVVNIYRVSSLKQYTTGDSLQDQQKICHALNEREEHKLDKEVEIVETGTDKERMAFDEVIRYCRDPKNKINALVFKSIDRFTRGGDYVYSYLKKELSKSGVELIDAYGFIQPDRNSLEHLGLEYGWSKFSPSENAEAMYANNAKQEVRDILTRMIDAEIAYTREGYSVRKAPMGYNNLRVETKVGERLIYEPHPTESQWIIAMYSHRAEGKKDDQIVDLVNGLGFKTRERTLRDKLTRHIIKKIGNNPLTVKQLQRYIKNPIYAGYKFEKWTNKKLIKTQNKGLVSVNLYNQANRGKFVIVETDSGAQLLKDQDESPGRRVRNKNNPNFPFKDILCPECYQVLLGSSSRSKSGKYVSYYHCCRGHARWSINKKIFEENVYGFIRKIDFTPEYAELFKDVVLSVWERKKEEALQFSINYGQQVEELKMKKQQLIEQIKKLTSQSVIQVFEKEIEDIELEIALAINKRDNQEDRELKIDELIAYTKYFIEHLPELLIDTTNPLRQKALFALLFDTMPNYQSLINRTPELSCCFQYKRDFAYSKEQLVTPRVVVRNQVIPELIQYYKLFATQIASFGYQPVYNYA